MASTKKVGVHSPLFQSIGTLLTGKSFAFIIALVLTPVIARLFTPEHFGVLAIFLAMANVLGSVASLRYERAIALPRRDAQAMQLAWLSLGLLVGACSGITALLVAVRFAGVELLIIEKIGLWAWALPFAVFIIGLISILEIWLIRTRQFHSIAFSDATGALLTGSSRVSFGVASGSSVGGLIVGLLIGKLGRILLLLRATVRNNSNLSKRITSGTVKQLLSEYRDFPAYNAPSVFFRSLSNQLPVLVFGVVFSPLAAGFYAMAERVVRMPLVKVASVIRRVYVQKLAEDMNGHKSLKSAVLGATGLMFAVALLPVTLLSLYGEATLAFVLGEQWRPAGLLVEIIVPWLLLVWTALPASSALLVLREQLLWLRFQFTLMILRLLMFGIGILLSLSMEATLSLFVWASVVSYMYIIAHALWLVERDDLGKCTPSSSV